MSKTIKTVLHYYAYDTGKDAKPAIVEYAEDECLTLLPRFQREQMHATNKIDRARQEKERADTIARAERDIEHATTERDGKLWLLDNGLKTDNWIFYSHTGEWCLGWRTPLTQAQSEEWRNALEDFPFPYSIKMVDGTKR